jgi:hypothetical protein
VTLRWSRSGVIGPAVSVELLARRAGGGWVAKSIAAALPDTGSWAWKVPASLVPGTRYRIRVRSCADPKIAASSARTFTVR